jgi:hypothetical protein
MLINQLFQSIKSIAKVLLISRVWKNPIVDTKKDLIIVGNGPSASKFLDESLGKIGSNFDFVCVNMFASQDLFFQLKPKFYLMSDSAFFNFNQETYLDSAKLKSLKENPDFESTQKLINKTWNNILKSNWGLTIMVPQLFRNSPMVKMARNAGFDILIFNYTVVQGFEWFENLIYSAKLGSPQSQNVINSCIFQGINNGFKNIYLIGVENNFHLNLRVSETNQLEMVDEHFYKVEKKSVPLKNAKGGSVKMHEFYSSLYKAFYAHHRLQLYAKFKGVNIYNSTLNSFIDAYERKQINFD